MTTLDMAGIITRICVDLKTKFAAISHTHQEYQGSVPVQLYNSSSGTSGTVNLSESVANYSRVKIFFKKGSSSTNNISYPNGSIEVWNPNGKYIDTLITTSDTNSSNLTLYSSIWLVSGNKITFQSTTSKSVSFTASSYPTVSLQSSSSIYITRVEGYTS